MWNKNQKIWQMIGDKIYDLIQNANSLQYEFLDNDSEYDNIASRMSYSQFRIYYSMVSFTNQFRRSISGT